MAKGISYNRGRSVSFMNIKWSMEHVSCAISFNTSKRMRVWKDRRQI